MNNGTITFKPYTMEQPSLLPRAWMDREQGDPSRPLDTLPKSEQDSLDDYSSFQFRIWGGMGWGGIFGCRRGSEGV